MEFLEQVYWLLEITREWLKNPKYRHYHPLFKMQHQWTVVRHIMDDLRLVQYWTLSMSTLHTVTSHQVITVLNDMINHMDAVM